MFAQVVSVVRGWAVFKGRGWEARLVEPGAPRSEGRGAGVLAVNGAAALNAGFIPDDEIPGSRDRPRNRVGGAPPRSPRCSSAFECPGPPRRQPCSGAGTAH